MRNQDEHTYYSRRTDEEIAKGDIAVTATVAAIHYELACRYARLAAGEVRETFELTVIEGGKRGSTGERITTQLEAEMN